MNRNITGLASGLPLALGVAASLATSPSPTPPSGSAIVTSDAYLMSGPLTTDAVVGRLTKGEPVTVLEQNWQYVQKGDGATGWVDRHYLASPSLVAQPSTASGTNAGGTEAITNPACPPLGTHSVQNHAEPYGVNSDAGLRNEAKRHIPAAGAPTTLTLADFAALQRDIDEAFGDAATTKTVFEPTRNALRGLTTGATRISEGDLVQLAGFVTIARDEGPESVNCGGNDGADIHINVGDKGSDEYAGIVVEMIPQLPRPLGWDSSTLNRLHTTALPILVVGGLTYDNEHFVNTDARHPRRGQPKRMSLWEIHPITEFYVCVDMNGCDPAVRDQWIALADWATANPQ